jgi:hypothetical protein
VEWRPSPEQGRAVICGGLRSVLSGSGVLYYEVYSYSMYEHC